jgi:hypothetical protein
MSESQNLLLESLQGRAGLDLDNPAFEELKTEQYSQISAINSDMRELFMDTDLGKRVLRVLIDWTIRQPTANPQYSEKQAFFREGQNDIVRSILSACHNSEES